MLSSVPCLVLSLTHALGALWASRGPLAPTEPAAQATFEGGSLLQARRGPTLVLEEKNDFSFCWQTEVYRETEVTVSIKWFPMGEADVWGASEKECIEGSPVERPVKHRILNSKFR